MSRTFTSNRELPSNTATLRNSVLVLGASLVAALTGCAVNSAAPGTVFPSPQVQVSGNVHGGQQPITSSVIQLYAVSSAGDGAPSLPLLTREVTTGPTGGFSFGTGDYTCPTPSIPVYLTATAGNPGFSGATNNAAISLMASLGACSGVAGLSAVTINEVTTIGTLAALFPFSNGYTAIGYQSSETPLINSALASISAYTNIATGSAPGTGLTSGYYASSQELYGLANSIAACINSPGGKANDGSACGTLFSLATPAGGTAPTDTAGAVVNILKNPTQNVAPIFYLAQATPPFQPAIAAPPAKWVLPIISTSNPTITLALSGPATVNVGAPAQYSASVTGTSNGTVTWQVNGATGGNSTYGTISPGGLYTPPAVVPAANALTITASSDASKTAAGSQPVTLLNPVPVVIAATGTTATYGQTFLVDVQGTGFVNGAALLVNGSPVATTAISLTDLQTTVVNTTGAALQLALAVANPSPGATQSTSSALTLSLPAATATAAARFLDQTSFGPTATTIAHVQQIGLLAALNEQFNTPTTLFTLPPDPDTECTSNWQCTQSDWVRIAATASDQLRQRMSLTLSEIWVAPNHSDGAMPYYLNTMASDSFTNYRTIMQDLTLAPPMGAYLNMVNSGAPPAGQEANENFGREVMQLFSLGLDVLNQDGTSQLDANNNPKPTYTETQVAAFARAYTGWTYANADGTTPTSFNGTANWNHAMVAVEARHDKTAKILLGGTTLPANGTAEVDLQGALDNIFAQSNVGPFVCRQLIQHLVSGNPTPAYVARVSAVFANNGSGVRGDMKAVITAILLDHEARDGDKQTGDQAEQTPAVQGGHLREPLLFVPNLLRGLNATQTNPADLFPYISLAANGIGSLGEQPFNQPSVFNYYPPSYVIPSSTVNAPEFDLENTATIIPRLTLTDSIIHSGYGVKVDLSATGTLGSLAAVPANLVDYLGMVFMHSQMPTDMRSLILTEVNSIPSTNPAERAAVAAYLVLTSSQYKILH